MKQKPGIAGDWHEPVMLLAKIPSQEGFKNWAKGRLAGLLVGVKISGGKNRLQKKHPTEIAQKMMDAIRPVSLGIMDYICNITLHIILMELLPKLNEEKNFKEHLFSDKGELNPVKTNSLPLKTWSCISIFPCSSSSSSMVSNICGALCLTTAISFGGATSVTKWKPQPLTISEARIERRKIKS